jgi:hypothetical protein
LEFEPRSRGRIPRASTTVLVSREMMELRASSLD